ncbi:hypothetical protein [Natrialba sp. SSL1]|uniref:hypothetical protein n=1 Tax=Natrialba sp. SSL1 TaxID=1869245 RepID=UPI0008F8257C|nr:hypothetical protein [Natrialba sp. SSL1]OIB59063.1 hypothetical protein BBD46_06045 [Natrialba sp. SSL1]
MVSRDTLVHIVSVTIGLLVLALVEYTGIGPETGPAPVAVFLLFYGLVLGGAHFYLALRGEDGLIPVEARWRYVATLVVLLAAGAAIFYGGGRAIATIPLESLGYIVLVVTLAAYLVTESVSGYRASRQG